MSRASYNVLETSGARILSKMTRRLLSCNPPKGKMAKMGNGFDAKMI